MAKKLKNEKALLRKALEIVMTDAIKRGVVEFEATDSHDLKIEFAYSSAPISGRASRC